MLEAHDLAGERGHARLFRGVAFRVEAGRALAVTGANGSGKTTLLRMLAGLTAPAAGTIRLNGEPMKPFDPRLREAVVFAGHLPALKDELTALGEPRIADRARRRRAFRANNSSRRSTASRWRDRHMLPARALSQGQRRRIGLARLRVLRKPLWILDEPATALDADGTALLGAMLAEHLDGGGTAVVATHQSIDLPPGRMATLAIDACAA